MSKELTKWKRKQLTNYSVDVHVERIVMIKYSVKRDAREREGERLY